MASLSWIDFVLRLIPEALLIILASYAISKKAINVKLWFLSSIILALLSIVFRSLPISRVLPMILSGISSAIILTVINKLNVIKVILSTIICFVILTLAEFTNMILLDKIFLINTEKVFLSSNVFMKNLYGLPSLIIFGLFVIPYYLYIRRKKN